MQEEVLPRHCGPHCGRSPLSRHFCRIAHTNCRLIRGRGRIPDSRLVEGTCRSTGNRHGPIPAHADRFEIAKIDTRAVRSNCERRICYTNQGLVKCAGRPTCDRVPGRFLRASWCRWFERNVRHHNGLKASLRMDAHRSPGQGRDHVKVPLERATVGLNPTRWTFGGSSLFARRLEQWWSSVRPIRHSSDSMKS